MLNPEEAVYPFTAVLGQDELKNCLILCAVDPRISGVLALGDRGTAKTTTVRALGQLLTHHGVNMPIAELPLGASEDRVLGTLDVGKAMQGEVAFSAGILSRAHGGFLYIDEVNLLDDVLVDVLLDVAASGINRVERDGISHTHAAQFVLVGSGNPEEGELRPQLEHRFGLSTHVRTLEDRRLRATIIHRRMQHDDDPAGFAAEWAGREAQLAERIQASRERLLQVEIPAPVLQQIVDICVDTEAVGHRAEVVLARAARALTAMAGRDRVSSTDVVMAAVPALRHRIPVPTEPGSSSAARVKLRAARVLGLRAA